jgi:intracellular sulfur oxidation DsrE/DsrF family protein
MKTPTGAEPRVLLHAPTAGALSRARSNAANLIKGAPSMTVRIVVNAEAVAAVLDGPDADGDALTLVCANTLVKIGREAPSPLTVLAEGAVLAIARMQSEGWCYVRA